MLQLERIALNSQKKVNVMNVFFLYVDDCSGILNVENSTLTFETQKNYSLKLR